MGPGQAADQLAVVARPPRAVQEHERRPVALHPHPRLDRALPEPKPAVLHRHATTSVVPGGAGALPYRGLVPPRLPGVPGSGACRIPRHTLPAALLLPLVPRGAGAVALAVFRATPCRGAWGVSPQPTLFFFLPGVWGCPPPAR